MSLDPTMASGDHPGDSLHLSELRIVLLGSRVAGKSSSGNTILGREEFDLRRTAQCVKRQGEVAGRQVTVVDTPGWLSNVPVELTPELVKQEIVSSVSLCPPGPHTLLLVIGVVLSFTEVMRSSVEEHLRLLSEGVWSHTIVLFTCGDCLGDPTIEQLIESEGKALQCLVEKCGNRYHVLNNRNRGDGTQVTELLEKIEEMVAVNSGDVFYPESQVGGQPSLAPRGAKSMEPPLNMSGGSRPDAGYGSELVSKGGSVTESARGARSMEPPLSLSGGSRAETGYDSELVSEVGSVTESLLKPEREDSKSQCRLC